MCIRDSRMTNLVFQKFEAAGIPTHFIEELNDRETAVKKVDIVPLEVIVRNVAAGSFSKRMGVEEGRELLCPILEFSYKNDDLGDPFINDDYALALGLATKEELDEIRTYTLKVNEIMKELSLIHISPQLYYPLYYRGKRLFLRRGKPI